MGSENLQNNPPFLGAAEAPSQTDIGEQTAPPGAQERTAEHVEREGGRWTLQTTGSVPPLGCSSPVGFGQTHPQPCPAFKGQKGASPTYSQGFEETKICGN